MTKYAADLYTKDTTMRFTVLMDADSFNAAEHQGKAIAAGLSQYMGDMSLAFSGVRELEYPHEGASSSGYNEGARFAPGSLEPGARAHFPDRAPEVATAFDEPPTPADSLASPEVGQPVMAAPAPSQPPAVIDESKALDAANAARAAQSVSDTPPAAAPVQPAQAVVAEQKLAAQEAEAEAKTAVPQPSAPTPRAQPVKPVARRGRPPKNAA